MVEPRGKIAMLCGLHQAEMPLRQNHASVARDRAEERHADRLQGAGDQVPVPFAAELVEHDPAEPHYDPVHLGGVLVVTLVVAGALFWLLWTLLVFEGGIFPKLGALLDLALSRRTLAELGYRGAWDRGVFEGWLGNACAAALAALLCAALHRLHRGPGGRRRQ